MRSVYLNINDDVSLGVYDPTKTSTTPRIHQSVVNTKDVLSPTDPVVLDVFTDTGFVGNTIRFTSNSRVFIITAIATGTASILLYNLDIDTGVESYVGRIVATFPNLAATTHVIRGLRVVDTGTTGWKILVLTTASVLVNGGVFCINNVDLSDFGPVSFTTFPIAHDNLGTGASNMKGVYFLQDTAAMGVAHVGTIGAGMLRDSVNNHLYAHNGLSATHQYYKFDLNASLVVDKKMAFTITIAVPGVVTSTAHGFANNDPVALYTTGALPTGLTASNATTQTVYFVRNSTANTFELSLTTGGASITTTGSQSGTHTVMRGFGQTNSAFMLKTGNLPALAGTLLQTNAEDFANPDHGGVLISGFPCAFIMTSTGCYVGRLSELTSAVTAWPSLTNVNLLGSTNEIVTPTAIFGNWSDLMQAFVYVTNVSTFICKKLINNEILTRFGGVSNDYLEGNPVFGPPIGLTAISSIDLSNGWFFTHGSTAGQRVVVCTEIISDTSIGIEYMYTPVIPNNGSIANFLTTIEEYFDVTSTMSFSYRSGPLASAQWATAGAGTWVPFDTASVLTIPTDEAYQIRISWDLMTDLTSTPAQLVDISIGYTPPAELSDNWVGSHENSQSISPSYSAFRLQAAYVTGTVPAMAFTATDDNGVVVVTAYTDTDSAFFKYTPDNGLTWLPLGTIPNVALTTELRYEWASPPGVPVRVGLLEKA